MEPQSASLSVQPLLDLTSIKKTTGELNMIFQRKAATQVKVSELHEAKCAQRGAVADVSRMNAYILTALLIAFRKIISRFESSYPSLSSVIIQRTM